MKRDSNQQHIGEVIKAFVERHRLRNRLNQEAIREAWEKLMGSSVARHTVDIKLYRKSLVVYLDSSVLRNELSYGKATIIERINMYFGERLIDEVQLK